MMHSSAFSTGRIVASCRCAPNYVGDELFWMPTSVSVGTSDQDEVMARYARALICWVHLRENDDTPEDAKQHVNELYARNWTRRQGSLNRDPVQVSQIAFDRSIVWQRMPFASYRVPDCVRSA